MIKYFKYLMLLGIALSPSLVFASGISYDATAGPYSNTSSHSFTPGSGAQCMAVIGIEGGVNGVDNVTTVTVDGIAATRIVAGTDTVDDYGYLYIYPLGSTCTGSTSHTVQVSTSSGAPFYYVSTYFNVSQSVSVDNSGSASVVGSATLTATLAVNTTNAWIVGMASASHGTITMVTSGYLIRGSTTNPVVLDSNAGLSTGNNTVEITDSFGATADQFLAVVSLAPYVAGSPTFSALKYAEFLTVDLSTVGLVADALMAASLAFLCMRLVGAVIKRGD